MHSVVTLGPREGKEIIRAFGGVQTLRADGDDTANAYTILEMAAAGATPGPPAHVHHEGEEASYILDGTLSSDSAIGRLRLRAVRLSWRLGARSIASEMRGLGRPGG